jgi:CRISPR-associated protein Cas1
MQLVLNAKGIKLSIDEGLFKVSKGDEAKRIPASKLKSIILHKSASITTDAVLEAIENEIDILFMDRIGKPKGRIWSHKYGSISTIRKNQVAFAASAKGVAWIIQNLNTKLDNQVALLLTIGKADKSTDRQINSAISKITKIKDKLAHLEYNTIGDVAERIRGFEGTCSRIYFEIISKHLPEQYRFEKRTQHPAFDMFNAMLNYAYGMLYGKVEAELIKAGIDPYLGVFHRDNYNRPVLVYDFIENFRVWADYVVINLCMQQVMFREFFDVENQVFYLNQHGKRILIQSFNDYFEEVIRYKGADRSREQHIVLMAQKLATRLKSN